MELHEVAFNRRLEMNFRYVCNCLLIADADGDGNLELTAGSRDGVICVYKMDQSEPWRIAPPMATPSGSIGGPFGLITALAAGDLFNKNAQILLSIAADGAIFAFRLAGVSTGLQPGTEAILQPCFRQLLPSNIKAAHISDIDGDGQCELIVALTDRVVRTYRFMPCATSLPPVNTANRSAGPNANSGVSFCCGILVALNKWESPAQITAFSLSPSTLLPDGGVTVLVSQPGDKYLLLKPKLCPENDPTDNLSDISVVYCETNRGPPQDWKTTGNGDVEKGSATELCSGRKSIDARIENPSSRRKKRLFVAANSYRIDLFHLISRYVTVVDHNNEHRIEFPTQIFSMAPAKVLSQEAPDAMCANDAAGKQYKELILACDWANNIYACNIDLANGSIADQAGGKQRRVDSIVTMKVFGPVMCFTAGYSESISPDELFVAVSTCEEKLFLYSVRVGKILRNLGKRTNAP